MEVCSKAFGYQRCEFCLRIEDLIFMYFAVGLILSIAIWNYYKWIYLFVAILFGKMDKM